MDRFFEEIYGYLGVDDRLEISLYLLNCGCAIDEQNKVKLLCEACEFLRFDVVKELVEKHNVDPNGKYHRTPPHWLFGIVLNFLLMYYMLYSVYLIYMSSVLIVISTIYST